METSTPLSKPKISVEQLDSLMSWAESKPIGKVEAIIALIQLVAVFAYIWARSKLEEREIALAKQKYEVERTRTNQSEIANDSLDNK